MNFADYNLTQEGILICEPCVCITLFSDTDLGVVDAPDVLSPYRTFLENFQNQISHCILDGDQMHAKKITPKLLENLPNEMSDAKRRKQAGVIAEIFRSASGREVLTPAIDFDYSKIGKPHTYIRTNFPLKWFDSEGLSGLRKYLFDSLKGFPLQAGYVGYCFSWRTAYDRELYPIFPRWLQRHPGIMQPSSAQASALIYGLTDIGWITLLGVEFLERMGGIDALKKAVSHIPQVTVTALTEGGAYIQIGDAPQLGDTHNGDPLSSYCELGKVLAPLRNRDALVENMSVPGMRERDYPGLRAQWIDRFFPK
jgi:Protein of unknown function (DUF3396)